MERKYYEAYDDRYRQVHALDLQWGDKEPTPLVEQVLRQYGVHPSKKLLEIGCGEGRDARQLLRLGYDLLATDVSPEAIRFCQEQAPAYQGRFQVLDCITGSLEQRYDFIYAVAVVHMLVLEEDRDGFYRFIRRHLKDTGIALICTMGDGTIQRQTDITTAFDMQHRLHEQTGKMVSIAGTSCRMVTFATFNEELDRNGLKVLQQGVSETVPGFNVMMYAVVQRKG